MTKEEKYSNIADRLAKEVLGVNSLETQMSDELDFHDLSVWSIKEALVRAVKEGEKLEQQKPKQDFGTWNQ